MFLHVASQPAVIDKDSRHRERERERVVGWYWRGISPAGQSFVTTFPGKERRTEGRKKVVLGQEQRRRLEILFLFYSRPQERENIPAASFSTRTAPLSPTGKLRSRASFTFDFRAVKLLELASHHGIGPSDTGRLFPTRLIHRPSFLFTHTN